MVFNLLKARDPARVQSEISAFSDQSKKALDGTGVFNTESRDL